VKTVLDVIYIILGTLMCVVNGRDATLKTERPRWWRLVSATLSVALLIFVTRTLLELLK